MLFSVSSLGLPGAGLDELITVARSAGCDGLELRTDTGQPVHVGLTGEERAVLRRKLFDAGLHVLALTSYVRICEPGNDDEVITATRAHLELGRDLGADGLRLFPGGEGEPTTDDDRAVRRLEALLDDAAECGVRLLIETHDSHMRGADAARLLDRLEHRRTAHDVRVIWDVVHTWRAGETPADTLAALGSRLGYVQIKDAVPPFDRPTPVLPGGGHVRLDDVADALRSIEYAGWVSLEWEKAWHPEIPELDDALEATRRWLDRQGFLPES